MPRLLTVFVLVAATASCSAGGGSPVGHFMLKSSAFADGQPLPVQFTCDGVGKSPPLSWSEPPSGTKGFALIVDDPDAPGGTFRHWGVWNLPAAARELSSGATTGSQAVNDFGKTGYGGACPPKGRGTHHYRFKLLALDSDRLDLRPGATVEQVEAGASDHLVGQAELTGTYERR